MNRRVVVVLGVGMLLSGCAANSAATQDVNPPGVTAPTLTVKSAPDITYPAGPMNGIVLDLRVSVKVDSLGTPDLSTLQVRGLGATDNRENITRWLERARFAPARQDGRNVAGVFTARFRARGTTRRGTGS